MTRPKLATYGDLPEPTIPGTMLRCDACCGTFSATRGDYFMVLGVKTECCDRPLLLVRKEVRYVRVRP